MAAKFKGIHTKRGCGSTEILTHIVLRILPLGKVTIYVCHDLAIYHAGYTEKSLHMCARIHVQGCSWKDYKSLSDQMSTNRRMGK